MVNYCKLFQLHCMSLFLFMTYSYSSVALHLVSTKCGTFIFFYVSMFLFFHFQLERLLGEHRSASSMLGATNDSSSDPTDSFMKKVAAERAKFMGSCVRAVELLQSTVEQLQDRSADALLRSHDTIVGKWLDGGDILPHRGDYPEYAPNLMTQKYVLAALFLNDPP